MKKYISLLLCLLMATACVPAVAVQKEEPLRIVSTIYPPYDFVRNIAGDRVELTMLLSPGAESHSFEPSPRDIITIAESDLFLYIGGETDAWVDRILESIEGSDTRIMPLLEMVEAKPEEIVEGMEHGHDHAHATDADAIFDRPLSDWAGDWASIAPLLDAGELDAYIAQYAVENDLTEAEATQARAAAWRTEKEALTVEADGIRIGDAFAPYTYRGVATVPQADGSLTAWYQYARSGGDDSLPNYVMLSDHGTGTAPVDASAPEDASHAAEEHAHAGDLAHTHMRYGDAGFDALLAETDWSPFYVEMGASGEQVVAMLMGHSHSHAGEEIELDEHVWTSPKMAKVIVSTLCETLSEMDPASAAAYAAGTDNYLAKLDALDAKFEAVTKDAVRRTLLFGDRFPFRYLADAYGLTYYAAFPGCATETEASAATVAFLIDKAKAEALPVVFTIEFSNGKIAGAISESSGAKVLEMHSCHNVSASDFAAGKGYLELMHENAEKLKEALN